MTRELQLDELREIITTNNSGIARMIEIAEKSGDDSLGAMGAMDDERFLDDLASETAAKKTIEQLKRTNRTLRHEIRIRFGDQALNLSELLEVLTETQIELEQTKSEFKKVFNPEDNGLLDDDIGLTNTSIDELLDSPANVRRLKGEIAKIEEMIRVKIEAAY